MDKLLVDVHMDKFELLIFVDECPLQLRTNTVAFLVVAQWRGLGRRMEWSIYVCN